MCGRYSITTAPEALRRLFAFEELPNLAPRFNVAPTEAVPAVRRNAEGRRHLALLRWGLVPFWARDLAVGAKMINARAESLAEKPAFRQAFAKRRCLLPADGFYEWQGRKAPKQPYRIEFAERRPFAFAGLWERWREKTAEGGEGRTVESVTIVTTAANRTLAPLHERMPVIVAPGDFGLWLDPASAPAALEGLLRPYPDAGGAYGALGCYAISTAINKAGRDEPGLIEPLEGARLL